MIEAQTHRENATPKATTPETITTSMIIEDLENGIDRTGIKEKYGLDRLEREVSASILAGIATGKPTVMRMDDEITDAETEEAKKSATTDYELEDFTFKPTYSRFIKGIDS